MNPNSAHSTALPRPGTTPGLLDRVLRRRLLERMAGLRGGAIVLRDQDGEVLLGEVLPVEAASADATAPALLPPVQVTVHDHGFWRAIAARGSVGAGEAYVDGAWSCSDLVTLVRLLVRNRALLDGLESGTARIGGWALRGWHALRRNDRAGARRNIGGHYDLGNGLFEQFLSSDLMYSSALFEHAGETLEQASARKLEMTCRKLQLGPGDRVVEIGTGWGGFALHAARHHGCHVTTTTISAEQHALASCRVQEAGLQDRVTLLREDFRDLQGCFDKAVSIEMVEAIGAANLPLYFATLGRLLRADGLALVQAITIEDHRYAQALASVDFIKRHVFPGSFIPSVAALLQAKARSSDLALLHLEDFGGSYAITLMHWRRRFMAQLPQLRALGYDQRFARLWEFYLAYCEGGFRERSIGVAQLLLARPGHADPDTLRAAHAGIPG